MTLRATHSQRVALIDTAYLGLSTEYVHICIFRGERSSSQQDGLFDGVKADIAIVRTRHMKLLGRCLVRTEYQ